MFQQLDGINWYLSASISVVSYSLMMICYKQLQKSYSINFYLFFSTFLSALGIFIINVIFNLFQIPSALALIYAIFGGGLSYIGNLVLNISMKKHSNIGQIDAVSKSASVSTSYIIALFLLSSVFDITKALGICLILLSLFLISHEKGGSVSDKWISWSIVSGLLFGIMVTVNKYAFLEGMSPIIALFISKIISSVLYGYGSSLSTSVFSTDKAPMFLLLLSSIFNILGGIFFFVSIDLAPNAGYPTAIGATRMIILYTLSIVIDGNFRPRHLIKHALSVMLAFLGVLLLS